jgi:hypothetical protein
LPISIPFPSAAFTIALGFPRFIIATTMICHVRLGFFRWFVDLVTMRWHSSSIGCHVTFVERKLRGTESDSAYTAFSKTEFFRATAGAKESPTAHNFYRSCGSLIHAAISFK